MASPLTLRLDDETRERLRRVARRKGLTVSEVIRRTVLASVEYEESLTPETPYESIADLIGCVRGGRADRSRATGRQFAELLQKRRRSR